MPKSKDTERNHQLPAPGTPKTAAAQERFVLGDNDLATGRCHRPGPAVPVVSVRGFGLGLGARWGITLAAEGVQRATASRRSEEGRTTTLTSTPASESTDAMLIAQTLCEVESAPLT